MNKLRDYPLIAAVFVTLLFGIFLIIPYLTTGPYIFSLNNTPFVVMLFIDFFIKFTFFAILCFLIIPYGIELPNERTSFREYINTIHLSSIKPVRRNILLGLSCSFVFCFSMLCANLIIGLCKFDLKYIFGVPQDISNRGWFIFIFMLIPGIWEEIAFRGVILPLLLKKYSKRDAILIDGILFGCYHFFNLVGGYYLLSIIVQVIFSTLCGISWAYLYIKAESLLPCIITHYFLNVFAQLFLRFPGVNYFLILILLIVFLGIVPNIICIVLIKYVIRCEHRNKEFIPG